MPTCGGSVNGVCILDLQKLVSRIAGFCQHFLWILLYPPKKKKTKRWLFLSTLIPVLGVYTQWFGKDFLYLLLPPSVSMRMASQHSCMAEIKSFYHFPLREYLWCIYVGRSDGSSMLCMSKRNSWICMQFNFGIK